MIAGGALFGVFSALTIMGGVTPPDNGMELNPQIAGLVAYAALIAFFYFYSKKTDK